MIIKLVHPSTILISGPTGCGKTEFVGRLIREKMFDKFPSRIIWVYSYWQYFYNEFVNLVEFTTMFDEKFYETLDPATRNLVILDDQMTRVGDSKVLSRLFTEGSHHRNISVIYIVQNLFDKGKEHRTISLNAQYMILFKNPRDISQIECLSRQMFPSNNKFLVSAFRDATTSPYGYLLVDLRPESEEDIRVRTKIFPGEMSDIYQPFKSV